LIHTTTRSARRPTTVMSCSTAAGEPKLAAKFVEEGAEMLGLAAVHAGGGLIGSNRRGSPGEREATSNLRRAP